jgi:hypothetical protein
MSRRSKRDNRSTMLDLWRPPRGAGDPVGCFATTYTFAPALFDEQCLARFLSIESEPDREDLAFLLERETRLGGIYAGVLVDYTQAGVEHSLRWDVLAARVPGGKQHAKLSLLAWADCVRVIVSSANLTEPGYRRNFEVASAVDFRADECDSPLLNSFLQFLRVMLGFVPAGADRPEVDRATAFLGRVEKMTQGWKDLPRSRTIRQQLACTLPGRGPAARSSLGELIAACRLRGASPHEAWIASPFFDVDQGHSRAAESLCSQMARGKQHRIWFCVPGSQGESRASPPRLFAPRSLLDTAEKHGASVTIEMVPSVDAKEPRPWHAKMIHFVADRYSALMIGSSNFTGAGLGLLPNRNIEANLVTLVDYEQHGREEGLLESVWSGMEPIPDPYQAEWHGPQLDEEGDATGLPLPAGFLWAAYRAGEPRKIVIRLDPEALPATWAIDAVGRRLSAAGGGRLVIDSHGWREQGGPPIVDVDWMPADPPEKLRVTWDDHTAFLPLNVDDARSLPAPSVLREMTADEMLAILAATDPGAALRIWERRRRLGVTGVYDPDLDSATPIDLDPLSRYRLSTTFLHRVRRRARIMAQLRLFIEKPAISVQSLEWRLRGLIGIEPLAHKFAAEFDAASTTATSGGDPREALLTLADLLIVLREARYASQDGAIPKPQFEKTYRPFVRDLAAHLDNTVRPRLPALPVDMSEFWNRVVERCQV